MGVVVDFVNNPIKVDEYVLYTPKWIRIDNYWSRLVIASIDTREFINRKHEAYKEMTLKQIYYFDDEPMTTQEWYYKITYGADNRIMLRPWVIPHG